MSKYEDNVKMFEVRIECYRWIRYLRVTTLRKEIFTWHSILLRITVRTPRMPSFIGDFSKRKHYDLYLGAFDANEFVASLLNKVSY